MFARKEKHEIKKRFVFLLLLLVMASGCVGLSGLDLPNPFALLNGYNPQTQSFSEGLKVSISLANQPLFTNSKGVIHLDAQNMQDSVVEKLLLHVFDTGNLVREGDCRTDRDFF